MTPPTSRKEFCKFIGLVNYYWDVWEIHSHMVVHLTNLTSSKINFKWTEVNQRYFGEIKRIMAHNILLAYPYFNR